MADGAAREGLRIHIDGIVQGVGFRPFVHGLAERHGLNGWVINTSAGVDVEVEGDEAALAAFATAIETDAPPLARIDRVTRERIPFKGYTTFAIRHSEERAGAFMPISPDICVCDDCLQEMADPADRRYRYPFINCTNCGPRFTIIRDIPYDRPLTTMAAFEMCDDCRREYEDPANRRFHAQPVACPACGPQVWLEAGGKRLADRDDAIAMARAKLRAGEILAIKGLGGFHLACDATNEAAVSELRRRKLRREKPFALMAADCQAIAGFCHVSGDERALLESRQRPIVLLARKAESAIARSCAPGQTTLGVMLPYTPLHTLLVAGMPPMVMTSGNMAEEPIATGNDEARIRLAPLADAFVMHDRDIHIRTDDSVTRVFEGSEIPIRRSRGYAPYPVMLPADGPDVLATGGELKNTFCVAKGRYAFLSHHIGDMENLETLESFESGARHFEHIFRVDPAIIACDLHPGYMATRYAETRSANEGRTLLPIQHHHAHIAALMAEHGLDGTQPLIGVAFDGTGYGTDGTIWGGEFLIADYRGYQRAAHLKPVPQPGGDAATRRVARMALAHLVSAGLADHDMAPFRALKAEEIQITLRQIEEGLNAPLTSSMGRLFDAAAALAGIRNEVTYEGQAAIEFEALADPCERGAYALTPSKVIDPAPLLAAMIADLKDGVPVTVIASRFHRGIALMTRDVCAMLREASGIEAVGLSGGVYQNMLLTRLTIAALEEAGFTVYIHRTVPANDGGIALGQAAIARATAT